MSNRRKVLLVEDNALCREVGKEFIEELGYESFVAEDGETALDLYERVEPDAVLMDIIMPGIGGLEAAAALLSRHVHVPMVFVSSLDAFPEGTASEIATQLKIHPKPATVDDMRLILKSVEPLARGSAKCREFAKVEVRRSQAMELDSPPTPRRSFARSGT